jgi:4-hydroxythreonine-4-phosphate dehydrogenase
MIKKKRVTIGVTMGDPSGIGPEVILKSFERSVIRNKRVVVIGDYNIMKAVYDILKIESFKLHRVLNVKECLFNNQLLNILDLHIVDMQEFSPGIVQAVSGNAAFEAVRKAVELAKNKDIDAIVTAPLNKEAIQSAGHIYPGHTEILADLTGTKDYAMFLYDKKLRVIHVSTHVSLLEAIKGLKKERIAKVIEMADGIMKKLHVDKPRIAVAGINPHSGENGLFGREEIDEIIPAIQKMKLKGMDVEGPCPPDNVFLQAVNGKYDIVVAMYHDQGHIPLKLLGFNTGVNVTVGLPFVRTSVDHGTAFEIAWKGKASENSMVNAILLSGKLSKGLNLLSQ